MGARTQMGEKSHNINILMVEDSKGDAFLFKDMMEEPTSDCRCTVTIAETLTEALDDIRFHKYDAVVLDLNLPDMSGIACVNAVHSQSRVPIVIYTGTDDTVLRKQSLQCGAAHYIVKGRESPYGLKFVIDECCSEHLSDT